MSQLLSLDSEIVRVVLATALGLFLGLEREWSQKPAGIRTFSLIALLGAVFALTDRDLLLVVGGLLVVLQGAVLAAQGLLDEREDGLSLTTAASMLVTYGVGVLVAEGHLLLGVVVAVVSSLLLVLKRELHRLAWGLSREELRSATEFAVLAFVVYPVLPSGSVDVRLGPSTVAVEPRVVWLMVVTVAGIGIVNYAVVQKYGGRGVAITGFFGGLASSTAVVGTMLDHVRQRPAAVPYATAAILLADAAMAVRNLLIAVAFTYPQVLWDAAVPLGVVIFGSVAVAAYSADWYQDVPFSLGSPFSLRNSLGFGALFLVVVLAGGLAQAQLGTLGFYATAALSGLVSSAGATTSAVLLYRGGVLSNGEAVVGILIATGASILTKVALTATAADRSFSVRVATWSAVLLVASGAVAVVLAL
ncbi:MAG: MgtC/SapB family protein [Haloarculaceae archaeon]